LEEKMNGRELGMGSPEHALNIYIENETSRILTHIGTRPNKAPDHNVLNNLLWDELGLY
jgi:hypothetical protein